MNLLHLAAPVLSLVISSSFVGFCGTSTKEPYSYVFESTLSPFTNLTVNSFKLVLPSITRFSVTVFGLFNQPEKFSPTFGSYSYAGTNAPCFTSLIVLTGSPFTLYVTVYKFSFHTALRVISFVTSTLSPSL